MAANSIKVELPITPLENAIICVSSSEGMDAGARCVYAWKRIRSERNHKNSIFQERR